ncbi:hypothetical protein NA56DRAFT_713415 [Hyaloscypha hepaticicola]|uniref:Uncharacterized protein n=1 Tax=Hyaloscypha hepaticicola TaxID=2082293 RepID=A0A2J6PDY3_9HELO|nr:hypothetical protein NA56DRAFT_713415 [Hyaloscypha hepaticicola]
MSKSKGSEDLMFTVWHWFCAFFIGAGRHSFYHLRLCKILLYFLEVGVNWDCYLLFRSDVVDSSKKSETERNPTHLITLQSLMRQLNPSNLPELLELMEKPGNPLKIPSSFYLEDYITFDFGMVGGQRFKDLGLNLPLPLGSKICAIVCGGKWMHRRTQIFANGYYDVLDSSI